MCNIKFGISFYSKLKFYLKLSLIYYGCCNSSDIFENFSLNRLFCYYENLKLKKNNLKLKIVFLQACCLKLRFIIKEVILKNFVMLTIYKIFFFFFNLFISQPIS